MVCYETCLPGAPRLQTRFSFCVANSVVWGRGTWRAQPQVQVPRDAAVGLGSLLSLPAPPFLLPTLPPEIQLFKPGGK